MNHITTQEINLQDREERLKLIPRGRPYFVPVVAGLISLGYRRNFEDCGTWIVRKANGDGTSWIRRIGRADDLTDANGKEILNYTQALNRALDRSRGERHRGGKQVTVADALDEYEKALLRDGKYPQTIWQVRKRLPKALLYKEVAQLTADELRSFRDSLKGAPMTINNRIGALKAAFNLLLDKDAYANKYAWEKGLVRLKNAVVAREAILPDEQVYKLVHAAYEEDNAFGLFVEVGAVTGARPSQIRRLKVIDLQPNADPRPRIMMPTSRKGVNPHNKPSHREMPITEELTHKLLEDAKDRASNELLLSSAYYSKNYYQIQFRRAATRAGLPKSVTYYWLRHSSIVRQIKARKPLQMIANTHDTSTAMIERHYAHYISSQNEMLRDALPDFGKPTDRKVVAFRRT